MLQCLVVAVRPLEVAELAELLAFEFDEAQGGIPKYCPALRLDDQTQAVLSTCSSLVTIINERWSDRQVVQFSHFSVKEFLVSNRLAPSLGDIFQYKIRPKSAHITLTQACLGLLLHSDDTITEKIVERSPLAIYAARHWVEHAQFEDVASHVRAGMETLFDPDKPHFEAWVGIHNLDPEVSWGDILEDPSPLYYSALCGFYDLVEHLTITHPEYVNAFGGRYQFPILAALGQGHVEIAELLLKYGADIGDREVGKTMLLIATYWLDDNDFLSDIVEFLLTHGADVNARDDTLTNSLHQAEENYGAMQVVTILLKYGADVNSQDNNGKTPLHRVIEAEKWDDIEDDEDVSNHVRLLLEHGAEVNRRDKDNQTPLLLAMEMGWFKTARILIEYGADVNTENKSGKTLLHVLLSDSGICDEDEVFDHMLFLLKHGAEVNKRDEGNETPSHLAIQWGWFGLAGIFLEQGTDANAANNHGMTPLHILSKSSIEHEVDALDHALLLLKHGAEVNKRDKGNQTPLHLAIRRNRFRLAGILIEHGADAIAENNEGQTPLHILSESDIDDETDVHHVLDHALLLLKHGAEVNKRDKDKETPLHLAIRWDWFKLAEILLKHGADVNAENNQGMTPLHILSKSGIKHEGDILDHAMLLLKHGADVNKQDNGNETSLHIAIRRNHFRLAGILLEHGTDANVENNQGMTPLHILSKSSIKHKIDALDHALLLFKHGAEVNKRDKGNKTPLHLAIRRNRFGLAGILLEHGADAIVENNKGQTPLHMVSRGAHISQEDGIRNAQLLLEYGADVNAQDNNPLTPLDFALHHGHLEIASLLNRYGAKANVKVDLGPNPDMLELKGADFHDKPAQSK